MMALTASATDPGLRVGPAWRGPTGFSFGWRKGETRADAEKRYTVWLIHTAPSAPREKRPWRERVGRTPPSARRLRHRRVRGWR